MGSEDNRMMEEALNDLREQIQMLKAQNAELKAFMQHVCTQIDNFLTQDMQGKI
jgi:hypothetical protein